MVISVLLVKKDKYSLFNIRTLTFHYFCQQNLKLIAWDFPLENLGNIAKLGRIGKSYGFQNATNLSSGVRQHFKRNIHHL